MADFVKNASRFVWAKSYRARADRGNGALRWNPLLVHMLDVAASCGALWDGYLAAPVRARLAEAFGGGDPDTARLVLMFLAALHDLGKACPAFLRQLGEYHRHTDRDLQSAWQAAAKAAGLPLPGNLTAAPYTRHEHLTAALLPRLFGCQCFRCSGAGPDNPDLHTVAYLLGGHHGHIPNADTVTRAPTAARREIWDPVHRELFAQTAETLDAPVAEIPGLLNLDRPSVLPAFAGLVVLSDWIGSSTEWFTFQPPDFSPAQYWPQACRAARTATEELRLHRWNPAPAEWSDLWPDTTPRPFQRSVIDHLPAAGPALVLIETDTASGKTNIALWCARHLARTNGYHGLYHAMPTRIATDKTAGALYAFLEQSHEPTETANLSVVYYNPEQSPANHALLDGRNPDTSQRGALDEIPAGHTDDTDNEAPARTPRVSLHPWLMRDMHVLISPFGIGTIDQLVLAVQPSTHWFVRLFGLINKTVIIDEAHAYQLYQQRLLEAAVAWLADAGASVVVLSATLPTTIRVDLITAWRRGLRITTPAAPAPGPITIVDNAGRVVTPPAPAGPPRHISYTLQPDPGPAALADILLAEPANGVTAVIRNRIGQAAALCNALLERAAQHGWQPDEIILLHGGQLPRDRLPVERRLLAMLSPGPDPTVPNPDRPARLLVIATSVIEHALDIDVDRLYSDLASIDLLIQRSGRMHRHSVNNPERPDRFNRPLLTVLWASDSRGLPAVHAPGSAAASGPGTDENTANPDGWIHPPYTLAAAWRTLHRRADTPIEDRCTSPGVHGLDDPSQKTGCFTTPLDSAPMIEATYGPRAAPPEPGNRLDIMIEQARQDWHDRLGDEIAHATRAFHPFEPRTGEAIEIDQLMSGRAHGWRSTHPVPGIGPISRLGEEHHEAVILYQQGSRNRFTYDPDGTMPADLTYHPAAGSDPVQQQRRQQQRDLLLNTIQIPARWFTGPNALPPLDTWRQFPDTALDRRAVLLLDPAGNWLNNSSPSLSYTPTTGLRRSLTATNYPRPQ